VDVRTLAKDLDPQSTAISKAFGLANDQAAFIGQAIFALAIEIGGGLGLWTIFGHGARLATHEALGHDDDQEGKQREQGVALDPAGPLAPRPLFGSRAHFFSQAVLPASGSRVSASIVYRNYQAWCHGIGAKPMSPQAFGRGSLWSKSKIGGRVYYLNCAVNVSPPLDVVMQKRLSRP